MKEILIIEDDTDSRRLVMKVLNNAGYLVCEANNVEEALKLIDLKVPHLIIVDLNLPGENGFSFLSRRKESSVLQQIPTMVLSVLNSSESVYKAVSLGADDYVTKPFNTIILLQKIHKLLRDRKFLRKTYSIENKPHLRVSLRATITRASEVGFILESPARFAPQSRLAVRSRILKELGIVDCIFQRGVREAPLSQNGQYLNKILVVGMHETIARQVRRTITRWK